MTQYYSKIILIILSISGNVFLHSSNINKNKCAVCLDNLNETFSKDAWNNQFHTIHEKEGNFCNSCSRIISKNITQGGFLYSDGRHICKLCHISIIEKKSSIETSYLSVRNQLEKIGFTKIPSDIPITLINLNELNEKYATTMHNNLKGITKIQLNNNSNYLYEIFILFGLPKIEFEAVLAHELLHVWLNQNNLILKKNLLEGFCNLGSALIYENNNTHFSKIHLQAMQNNPNIIYGEGYRKMKSISKQFGWKDLIENLLDSENKMNLLH